MLRSRVVVFVCTLAAAFAVACGRESATPVSPGAATAGDLDAAADGSTLKATAPTPLSPVGDQQISDGPTLTASNSTLKFGGTGTLQYRFEVKNDAGTVIQTSPLQPTPTFRVTASLEFRKRHTWRARAEMDGTVGPWSAAASFISPEGGYLRAGEVLDPLYNGSTVGEIIGPVTFLPNRGVRLDTIGSYVRYLIPGGIQAGEMSMEVEGLRANAPGDKSKVFGMQQGTGDYIVDPYRVDIQYRGTGGFPANAITFRAIYGDADDLDVRYEPETHVRLASAIPLDPNTTYFWKATWGAGREFRVTVREGGINGRIIYDHGVPYNEGVYNPQPHYAFIGTPAGRSGAESATIPGTIYRNVWISSRARPQ